MSVVRALVALEVRGTKEGASIFGLLSLLQQAVQAAGLGFRARILNAEHDEGTMAEDRGAGAGAAQEQERAMETSRAEVYRLLDELFPNRWAVEDTYPGFGHYLDRRGPVLVVKIREGERHRRLVVTLYKKGGFAYFIEGLGREMADVRLELRAAFPVAGVPVCIAAGLAEQAPE